MIFSAVIADRIRDKVTRKEFEETVYNFYNVRADYPFEEDFVTGVFRHEDSGRWFAIAMEIPRKKLGLDGNNTINVVNFKCAPEVIESIAGIEPGIFHAYHMNKTHWLTVALDGSCDDETIRWLLGISFDLTAKKRFTKKITPSI